MLFRSRWRADENTFATSRGANYPLESCDKSVNDERDLRANVPPKNLRQPFGARAVQLPVGMISPLLHELLEPVARRYRWLQLGRGLAACWALAALLAIALGAFGVDHRFAVPLVGLLGLVGAAWLGFSCLATRADPDRKSTRLNSSHT